MNKQFLIPANTKRGLLILNIFRPIDLAILLTGVIITFILLILCSQFDLDFIWKVLSLIPALTAGTLVYPIENYHNVMVCIGEIIKFYRDNKEYELRGWCVIDEPKRKQKSKSKKKASKKGDK